MAGGTSGSQYQPVSGRRRIKSERRNDPQMRVLSVEGVEEFKVRRRVLGGIRPHVERNSQLRIQIGDERAAWLAFRPDPEPGVRCRRVFLCRSSSPPPRRCITKMTRRPASAAPFGFPSCTTARTSVLLLLRRALPSQGYRFQCARKRPHGGSAPRKFQRLYRRQRRANRNLQSVRRLRAMSSAMPIAAPHSQTTRFRKACSIRLP